MQQLRTKQRLLCFDGEVLEMFHANDSGRYHVQLMSGITFNEKRNQLEFDYGLPPMLRPMRLGFDAGDFAALREFMAPVIDAAS